MGDQRESQHQLQQFRTMLPLLPRTALHLLNAFILIAIIFIVLFPTLGLTQSVYRQADDTPSLITDATSFPTDTPNIMLNLQQATDNVVYKDTSPDGARNKPNPHPPRASAWSVALLTLRVIWSGILLVGQFLSYLLHPLRVITIFLLNKFLFLLQPFIIMGTGFYTLTITWPIQLVNYLTNLFYPLYIFLACASIVGLLVGGLASFTTTFLNNTIFPPPPPKHLLLRPKTPESVSESTISSGTVSPVSPSVRVPPPSKFPSSTAFEDLHILDTNALFSSFSLPIPPATPPGILYSAPTPAGSVSGRVGETIFEEEDDSDEDNKTPVAQQESWGFGAGRPLARAESAHGRMSGSGQGGDWTTTWHGKIKREDVDARGVDWRDDEVRRRKFGAAV